jgi:hypothetical protein
MRTWIFFQVFKARYEMLKQLDSKDIAELRRLPKAPVLVEALVEAVAAMFGISGDWNTLKKNVCHPDNVKHLHKINIVEIHRDNLLSFRKFRAIISTEQLALQNKPAVSLYNWAVNVDELYKMTNKEEFALVQEKWLQCAAQSPSAKLRQFFKQGSYFSKPTVEPEGDTQIIDINNSPDQTLISPIETDSAMTPTDQVHRDSNENLEFSIHEEDLRKTKKK